MAGNVKIIPPREKESSVLRVAAYCRVSTDHAEQALSYASQIRNYTDLINDHEGWVLVDVYADEAVSGTMSSPMIKCKKTPRKKCSFVAEVKGKR